MRLPSRLAPPSWLRLPARTARLRLTMLYGVLFLASGAGVLAITYLLVSDTTENGFYINAGHRSGIMPSAPGTTLSAPETDSVRSGQLSGTPPQPSVVRSYFRSYFSSTPPICTTC